MRGHRTRGPRLAAGALAVVLALGGCGGDDDEPERSEEAPGETVAGRAPDSPASDGTTGGSPSSSASTAPPDAPPGPLADVRVELTEVARVDQPTKLVARPGSDLLYVTLKEGRVVALEPDGDGLREAAEVLDLTSTTRSEFERGVLGLAFSLDGEVMYVHHSGSDGETRVAAYAMDGDVADEASRTDVLTVDQPFDNHNGGEILIDPDGLLWIGLGDGGSAGDPDDRAQDPNDLLGKVLRIAPPSPGSGGADGIPPDNPFADGGGRPEVVITGARNPWRMRFDPADGSLWIADVGQGAVEEINRLPADAILGTNLGWPRFEGGQDYEDWRELQGPTPTGPIFEMTHDDGWCSVTGGPVYRGAAIPDLAGAYVFGDYCRPGLSAIRLGSDGAVAETVVLDDQVASVTSVDTDGDGELYVLTIGGQIFRVDPA